MPCPPSDLDVPIYGLGDGQFLVDDSEVDCEALFSMRTLSSGSFSMLNMESEESSEVIRNYQKFMGQAFGLIDTNSPAANDTNLYNVCVSFPSATNTLSILQILPYGTDAVVIKASHFDYSSETGRDFALLVCDDAAKPVWKNIDFAGASDAEDGWLVQGTVPNWQVSDPMYFLVTNLNHSYNAFFRAIPYGGPQVQMSGPVPDSVVSNTIAIYADITDLSGVANEQFNVTVDGDPSRFALGASNTISLNTKYNPAGVCSVYLKVANHASVYESTNVLADNAKLFFQGTASLPLDFENDTYLVYSGDNASPIVGEIYSLFSIDKAQEIEASISDPSDGHLMAYYHGNVPYAATVQIPWNFTETDGVTPYTNDTYVVTFTAFDPTTITITNKIDRHGVRKAAGCILTYEEEDPTLSGGPYLNAKASTWVTSLAGGYESLYWSDWASLTQYDPADIGPNRDNPPYEFPYALTSASEPTWATKVCTALTNLAYSDFGYYMGHANGTELGGGPAGSSYMTSYLPSSYVKEFTQAREANPDWRMRKVAMWACYTDSFYESTAGGTLPRWQQAFGIRETREQTFSFNTKNVGLFFHGGLPQSGYSGTFGGTSVEVAVNFDDIWVTGPTPYPGACDPTYAFVWVVNVAEGMSPEMLKGDPACIGFAYLPYTGIYDGELVTNNVTHIKR
jgi:hypothetical protein